MCWVIRRRITPWVSSDDEDKTGLPTHQPVTLKWRKGDLGSYVAARAIKAFPAQPVDADRPWQGGGSALEDDLDRW